MDDTVGGEGTNHCGFALGSGFGLGCFELRDITLFGGSDGAVDFFGQEFGVAVVGNHMRFGC